MTSLVIQCVRKRFGSAVVLDDISLEIRAGEFLVVLGPSGCGKSTLLRTIAGLESIDSGTIQIDGRRVDHLPPGNERRRELSEVVGAALHDINPGTRTRLR